MSGVYEEKDLKYPLLFILKYILYMGIIDVGAKLTSVTLLVLIQIQIKKGIEKWSWF